MKTLRQTLFALATLAVLWVAGAQVDVNLHAQVNETSISFVSDDGNGIYTFAGNDNTSTNGYLAVWDNGVLTELNFPPRTDLGTDHVAAVGFAVTKNSRTFAYGNVAHNVTDIWDAMRKYENGNLVAEKIVRNVYIRPYASSGNVYLLIYKGQNFDPENSGWVLPQGEGWYFAKLNETDLSLEWNVYMGSGWRVKEDDEITSKAFRYPVQELPNGNIAVIAEYRDANAQLQGVEFWEYDPVTGQHLGTIVTGHDPDSGTYTYKWHRWKPAYLDGRWVLVHHFHESLSDPNDTNGHMEIWAPSSGDPLTSNWANLAWERVAKTDWGIYDLYLSKAHDWEVVGDTMIRFFDRYLNKTLSHVRKGLDINYPNTSGETEVESWETDGGWITWTYNSTAGTTSLWKYTVTGFPQERTTVVYGGDSIHGFRGFQDSVYVSHHNNDGTNPPPPPGVVWDRRYGESTIVLPDADYDALAQRINNGETVDPDDDQTLSWSNMIVVPSGYQYLGATPLGISSRPSDSGKIFYRIGTSAGDNYKRVYLRVYLERASDVGVDPFAVEENPIEGLTLYPNPVEDELHVRAEERITAVAVYDLRGRLVRRTGRPQVDMHDLAPGVYMLRIRAGDKWALRRVVKK